MKGSWRVRQIRRWHPYGQKNKEIRRRWCNHKLLPTLQRIRQNRRIEQTVECKRISLHSPPPEKQLRETDAFQIRHHKTKRRCQSNPMQQLQIRRQVHKSDVRSSRAYSQSFHFQPGWQSNHWKWSLIFDHINNEKW